MSQYSHIEFVSILPPRKVMKRKIEMCGLEVLEIIRGEIEQ